MMPISMIFAKFAIIRFLSSMRKIVTIILLIFTTAFSIKAVEADTPDSVEISYDHVYGVDWTVNVYPVANVIAFPQDSVDKVVDAMQSPAKEYLFGGNYLLCYYLDTSLKEAEEIKREIGKVDLPDGYKWGFGFIENENQKLTLIAAVCKLKFPFSATIGQAFFEKDSFGKPSIGFSLRQGESEEPLEKFRKYRIQHKNNVLVIDINGWLFAPTQINQLDIPITWYITISYVPHCILEDLYKPLYNPDLIIE